MQKAMQHRADELGLELAVAAPQAGIAREIRALRRVIARTAAAQVAPGDTILINHGEVSLFLAEELRGANDVTVVTNSLDVLERLAGRAGLKVILTSGELHAKARCLVGPSLGALFETLRVDMAFLAVDGISARFGPSAADERMALAARRFVHASRAVYVMADHSLVGQDANHRIVSLDRVDELITDSGSLPADRLAFASAGTGIAIADEETGNGERPAFRPAGRLHAMRGPEAIA
jgi:DeoR/GlpR family transcriptional regulator of sugar metabolism